MWWYPSGSLRAAVEYRLSPPWSERAARTLSSNGHAQASLAGALLCEWVAMEGYSARYQRRLVRSSGRVALQCHRTDVRFPLVVDISRQCAFDLKRSLPSYRQAFGQLQGISDSRRRMKPRVGRFLQSRGAGALIRLLWTDLRLSMFLRGEDGLFGNEDPSRSTMGGERENRGV